VPQSKSKPGPEPEVLKIELPPEEALARLLRPKKPASQRPKRAK
jgi:hypothetical protein